MSSFSRRKSQQEEARLGLKPRKESQVQVCIEGEQLYCGEWTLDGKTREGWGILVSSEGDQAYEGYFKNNRVHGLGRLIYEDGLVQEGRWENDMLNGECRITEPDGTVFIGMFVNHQKQGKGT